MRLLRHALIGWGVIALVAWAFGPVGFVVGGAAFLGGFALGHRAGRREATYDAAREIVRDRSPEAFTIMDGGKR